MMAVTIQRLQDAANDASAFPIARPWGDNVATARVEAHAEGIVGLDAERIVITLGALAFRTGANTNSLFAEDVRDSSRCWCSVNLDAPINVKAVGMGGRSHVTWSPALAAIACKSDHVSRCVPAWCARRATGASLRSACTQHGRREHLFLAESLAGRLRYNGGKR